MYVHKCARLTYNKVLRIVCYGNYLRYILQVEKSYCIM